MSSRTSLLLLPALSTQNEPINMNGETPFTSDWVQAPPHSGRGSAELLKSDSHLTLQDTVSATSLNAVKRDKYEH